MTDRPAVDLNAGVLAPVADEVDVVDLPVDGTLPPELDGVLIRNGPNPLDGRFDGAGVLDWWPEAAMVHAIDLRGGRATGYRNRWVRTRRWAEANEPATADALVDTNPNVNVVAHAGEVLALAEGGPPLRITPELTTLGPAGAHPALAAGSTAHPKVDPGTGELMSFVSTWAEPFLRYSVSGPGGDTLIETSIDLPHSVMLHDLAITADHSIVFDQNVGYDLSMLAAGHRIPIRWHHDRPARLGVLPRHGGPVRWFEIEPCFVQHTVNATAVGEAGRARITVDAVRYPWYFRVGDDGFDPDPLGVLWRWTIDLDTDTVTEGPIPVDHPVVNVELPRIDEARTGRPYRHLWCVEQPTEVEMRGIRHHDLGAETMARWVPPPGDQTSEPVFAPRPDRWAGTGSAAPGEGEGDRGDDRRDDDREGDGWVLATVYRAASDTTDLVVLDALDLAAGPVATVHLPRRIPAGFHGAWLPR